jgi:hypothetical protein
VRLHGNEADATRQFNRTENVRVIPPSDPDFKALYARRNDAESINRAIDDSMWLRAPTAWATTVSTQSHRPRADGQLVGAARASSASGTPRRLTRHGASIPSGGTIQRTPESSQESVNAV